MIRSNFRKSILAIAVGATLSAPIYAADDTRGFLRGAVVDASGHDVAGATVTITNTDLGLTRTVQVGSNGSYRFPALVTGTYDIVVTKGGEVVSQSQGIEVGLGGKTTRDIVIGSGSIEELEVVGIATTIDTSSAVKDFVINADDLVSSVPVPRDLTSVALLAPSTVASDRTFAANNHDEANIAISGASAAENACFVNGLNITNFRNGLGCSQVPFAFFETVQIKNGGYNAEFGRSIGGVMNTTTKRGSNEFEGGVNSYWSPDALRSDSPNTYIHYNDEDERDSIAMDFWSSGAIIQDKLFYYVQYSPEQRSSVDATTSNYTDSEWDNSFWGLKLDYVIADGHTLEYTGFDDTREEVELSFGYDRDAGGKIGEGGETIYSRGGQNHIFKYTGVMNDWMTLSAQYGVNEYERTDSGELDVNPVIFDDRGSERLQLGNWGAEIPVIAEDKRTAWRIDADFFVGDHTIRAGLDNEFNESLNQGEVSGGIRYIYGIRSGDNAEIVQVDRYVNGGEFNTDTTAFYIQDEWQATDQLTLHFGIRNESFDNRNANDKTFVKIDDQWAPRLGLSFDPTGDATSRIYANYGRYFMPVAANTNIRMAGSEIYTRDWYLLEGLNADDTPIFNESTLYDSAVFGNGVVPDTRTLLDQDLDPMYQDEFIIGYEWAVNDEWNLGVRGVYRNLKSTLEDVAIDAAVIDYYNSTGSWDTSKSGTCHDRDAGGNPINPHACSVEEVFGGFHQYVLTNPGSDMTTYIAEMDETVTLSADALRYPEATRTYKALEFTFDRTWDGKWSTGGSVVLSKAEGNHEGYVKSDNGQDDAGITTSFDQPGLVDGMDGDLPNDRSWTVKLWGNYQFDNGLVLSGNFRGQDGRPINCIGYHPTDVFAHAYGRSSLYCGGELQERGSGGRTSDVYNIDVGAQYAFNLNNGSELVLRADVFNLFDFDSEVEVREIGDATGHKFGDPVFNQDLNYGKDFYYQEPRNVRLSANYRF